MTTAPEQGHPDGGRPLTALFTELTRETTALFRQEIQLARMELTEKVAQAGFGLGAVAVGAAVLMVAVLALVAAAILALATVMAAWQAALLVGVALALAGALVLGRGLAALQRRSLTPQRTLAALRANAHWARERMP